ncbi:unnamed protein product [Symbiodinium sp. CCMP2592]|nr:unnamed protein product [Symbiodinium sp. CCMP2592]
MDSLRMYGIVAWGDAATRDWEVWPDRSEEAWGTGTSQNWEEWPEADQEESIPDPRYIEAHDLALEPTSDHGFTMLLLHSCSGGPDDWIPIIHRLDVPFRNEIRFVVPCAPVRRETFDGWTKEQNSWFTYSQDGQHAEDPQELQEQMDRMEAILRKEVEKLPGRDARRLLVGGFSQGVALAVELARRHGRRLGGVICMRGAALSWTQGQLDQTENLSGLRVLAYHGRWDRLCPPEEAGQSYEPLRVKGADLRFIVDETLGHACARGRQQLCGSELEKVSEFLKEVWGEIACETGSASLPSV